MTVIATKYNSVDYTYQGSCDHPPVQSHEEYITPKQSDEQESIEIAQHKRCRLGSRLASLKLEFAAFVFTFSYVLTKVTSTVMVLEKVCLVHFEYPPHVCANLTNSTDKSSVEKLAANYNLAITLIRSGPAAILACFIGSWSDQYGRKLPVMVAIFGMTMDSLGSTVCAYFLQSRVEFYFIPALFTGLFGGPISVVAVVYSYASDLTPINGRIMKYAFVEIAIGIALPAGSTMGGWMYELLGYPPVFLLSAGGFVLSLLFVGFLLEETRGKDNDDPWSVKLRELFSCKSFVSSFQAVVKKRPHQGRKQVILLIASVCFLIVSWSSLGDINYLYAFHQFEWGNAQYSTITAIYSAVGMVLLVVVIPLLKRFKTGEAGLGLIGTISILFKNIGIALSWKTGVYHAANLLGLLGGCSVLAVRSRISKVVSKEDLGKVFSLVAAGESLLPILTSIMVTQIFNVFIQTFPGMPYLFLASLLLLPLGVFSWMSCLPSMTYEDMSHIAPKREQELPTSKTEASKECY